MKTKTTSAMVALIISLIAFFVLRLMIFLFVAEPGIILEVNRNVYSFSRSALVLGLWAFIGFPATVISLFLLWERRRNHPHV